MYQPDCLGIQSHLAENLLPENPELSTLRYRFLPRARSAPLPACSGQRSAHSTHLLYIEETQLCMNSSTGNIIPCLIYRTYMAFEMP